MRGTATRLNDTLQGSSIPASMRYWPQIGQDVWPLVYHAYVLPDFTCGVVDTKWFKPVPWLRVTCLPELRTAAFAALDQA
jgi:hypothetical protein